MRTFSLVSIPLFLTPVLSFRILVQPTTSIGAPTTVLWVKNSTDPSPLPNLRFVTTVDGKDVPLTRANVNFNVNSGAGAQVGAHSLGKEVFVFPSAGRFSVKAIFGQEDQVLGTSNEVVVSEAPSGAAAAPPAAASAITNAVSKKPSNKTPLLVGAVLGALFLLVIIVVLVRFLLYRRQLQRERDRLSFHPEQMVQRRRSLWMDPEGGASVAEGGAVVVTPLQNPFAGGTPFRIDDGPGRRESTINPFKDPPQPLSINSTEPPSQSAPENPFSDPRKDDGVDVSPPKSVENPRDDVREPTEAPPLPPKGHVETAPAVTPVRNGSIKTARPLPTRPLPTPLLIHKGHLAVPSRHSPRSRPSQVPLSAPVHQSTFSVDIPPSPLTPSRSKPQRLMDRRLEQVQSQLEILRRRNRKGGVDPEVAKKLEDDLEKKADWLRKEIVRGWAGDVEEDNEVPNEDRKEEHVNTGTGKM